LNYDGLVQLMRLRLAWKKTLKCYKELSKHVVSVDCSEEGIKTEMESGNWIQCSDFF
jgi:hypothetical protein